MPYFRALAVLVTAASLFAFAGLQEKDKTAPKDTAPKDKEEKPKDKDEKKYKGFLPANFGKLGLTDTQRQKIYKLQADYGAKLEEIEKAKAKLKGDRDDAIEKVLTPEQLDELMKIRTGKKDKPEKDK